MILKVQVSEVQDKVDSLNEEFTRLSRQSLEADHSIKELEQELMAQMDLLKDSSEGSVELAQHRQLIRESAGKLTSAKSNRDSLALQRSNCLQRFELFKKQLEEKSSQLELYRNKPENNERQQQTEKKLQSLTKGQKKRAKK
jgi:hypothetical protein